MVRCSISGGLAGKKCVACTKVTAGNSVRSEGEAFYQRASTNLGGGEKDRRRLQGSQEKKGRVREALRPGYVRINLEGPQRGFGKHPASVPDGQVKKLRGNPETNAGEGLFGEQQGKGEGR